ncbi:MAG: hypothetical protein ACPLXC_00600 [Candidatus Pacearchaeota archaeon]
MIKRGIQYNSQNKKAQVTLFIIIAIVVIALILLTIFLTGGFKTVFTQAEIAQVKSYLDDCFKSKTQQGILFIARQGGYNTLPEASINFIDEKTAYYWKANQTLVPSISTVESELASWLDVNARDCLKMPGYALTVKTCKTQVEIEDVTKAIFDCPVTIQKGMATTQFKDFNVEIEAPVTKLLGVSSQVVDEYKKQKGFLNLDSLENVSSENNVFIHAVPVANISPFPDFIWFIIQDNEKPLIEEKNLTWRFVVEY